LSQILDAVRFRDMLETHGGEKADQARAEQIIGVYDHDIDLRHDCRLPGHDPSRPRSKTVLIISSWLAVLGSLLAAAWYAAPSIAITAGMQRAR
jgi:hypothetical protein